LLGFKEFAAKNNVYTEKLSIETSKQLSSSSISQWSSSGVNKWSIKDIIEYVDINSCIDGCCKFERLLRVCLCGEW
jgi:hypothetical protein